MEMVEQRLPSNWIVSSLGEVCSQPQYGYTTSASNSGNLKLLRTTDITSGDICWRTVPFCSENPADEEKYLLEHGDIVISRAGSVGVSYLLKNPERSVFASYLIRFKPYIDERYFKYFLDSPYYWKEIAGNKLGIAVPNVNASKLKDIAIPLSPENEQHRIVAKIEELFSELDKGVESLKTAQAQLKVYRQSLLKHAFEGKLTVGLSAVAWVEKPLGGLLDFLTSGSRGWAQFYSTKGDLFIRAQNIKHDRLDLGDIAFVSLPERAEGLRTRVQNGDLLITITGANVTKSALVERDLGVAYVSQHVALCRPTADVLPRFLYWFIVAEAAGRKQLNKMAYGAGKPGLNLENIRSVLIPLPGLPEQEKIVEEIEDKLSVIEQLDQIIATALQQGEVLRQSILKKAFSGQLVAQDANDEPAAVLLERIKAERAASPTKARLPKVARPEDAPVPSTAEVIPFPIRIAGISATDLHAGILARAYQHHEQAPKYLAYFGHVKAEKIAHLVEAHLGIELGREAVKAAAGPNDYPCLKKVESRAAKANWFCVRQQKEGGAYVFSKLEGFEALLGKTHSALGERAAEVDELLGLLLPLNTRQAEIVATLYAAWNNLLLHGRQPDDEAIVCEARENWHASKLAIDRDKFFRGLGWMREKGLIPSGRGRLVTHKGVSAKPRGGV